MLSSLNSLDLLFSVGRRKREHFVTLLLRMGGGDLKFSFVIFSQGKGGIISHILYWKSSG